MYGHANEAFAAVAGFKPTFLISACVVVLELVTADGVGEASGDLSLHLRLSFASEPRTRMARNSSLESQAFNKRASTGNRLLFPVLAREILALILTN